MTKIIALFVLFACSSIQLIFAQDILVKKDGTAIKAKIQEIGTTEIKYKAADNLDGPTYVIPKSDVLSINYENGTHEIINSNQQISTTIGRESLGSSFVLRNEVDNYYKQARTLKVLSWIVTGIGVTSLIGSAGIALSGDETTFESPLFWTPVVLGTGCVIAGFPMRNAANNKIDMARRISQSTVTLSQFKIGNTRMTPMLSLCHDNITHKKSFSIGCSLQL